MGFYVDTAEMKKAVEEYQKISKKAQAQLTTAKNAMNGIINSNAMSGKVGKAISADINNNQNAVIVGLQSSYLALEMELREAYQDFKGTTGESSDSAVLSEEVLNKAKSDIDKMKQTYQEQVKSFQSVYNSISDLISLSISKSDFTQVADATKKYADEIIRKVNQFDSKQGNSANEDMIQSLGTQIKAAQKVGGLSYTDPRFLAFANSGALADSVQSFQKKVTEAEEKQRKAKEADLNSMTPSEMIAKYGVDDPDVKKRINDINRGITFTALGSVLQTSGTTIAGEHLEKGVQKVGSMYGEKVSNSIWANRYSITMPDGRIMGQTSGATLAAREAAESTANSIAKHAGRGLTEVAGTFVGVGIDMWQGDTAEEAWGKEITTGIVTGIGVAILGATPIGAGIGVTIGAGVIVGMGNDWLRDNFDGVKEFEDNVGSAIVSGWNTVSNGVSDFFGGVFS